MAQILRTIAARPISCAGGRVYHGGIMVEITMLNAMAGGDFAAALDRHVQWKLKLLDLKDGIFGRGIVDLAEEQAQCAGAMIRHRGLDVYCFSTGIGYGDIEAGEQAYRREFEGQVRRAIELASILKPRTVRLLAARTSRRAEIVDSAEHIRSTHPWLIEFYREAIDQLSAAGLPVVIENEVHGCIWSRPEEILSFFQMLDRRGKVLLTWDVQNLWQMGTFPSVQVYEQLKPLIGLVHLKGGMVEGSVRQLKWRSALEDASWPVAEIVGHIIADGVSPVICLNPSHGEAKPGYNYDDVVGRDLAFMRRTFPEVAR